MLWKDIWETLGLQGFEQIYPEYVADLYTMLKALDLQLKLAQLEQALQQQTQQATPPPAGAPPPAQQAGGGGLMELLSPFAEGLAQGQAIGQQLFGGGATPGPEMAQAASTAAPPEPMVPPVGQG